MATNPHRIVVLGAGYAGVVAARRLARHAPRGRVAITLVNASHQFVERVRLHELAAGQPWRERPLARLLRGTGIELVTGRVSRLDLDQKSVRIDGGTVLGYDTLVYALGSVTDRDSVPGAREHALTVGEESGATRLRETLPALAARSGRLVICGGGLTGIESAADIAEAYPNLRVTLVTRGAFAGELSERARKHIGDVFDRMGVTVRDGAEVVRVDADAVQLAEGTSVPFDACLWAGAFVAPPLAREAGLLVNGCGQIVVDPYLRSLSHPDVVAVGDGAVPAAPPGAPIRMACATAAVMAAHGADCLVARLRGAEERPFQYAYAVRCISLGRRDGVIQLVHPDDTPKEQAITGRAAAAIKEQVNSWAYRVLTWDTGLTLEVRYLARMWTRYERGHVRSGALASEG